MLEFRKFEEIFKMTYEMIWNYGTIADFLAAIALNLFFVVASCKMINEFYDLYVEWKVW